MWMNVQIKVVPHVNITVRTQLVDTDVAVLMDSNNITTGTNVLVSNIT